MFLDRLPVELAAMVFAELPYRSQLCLRETCKYMASIGENYAEYGCQLAIRGRYDRWNRFSLQMKILSDASFRCKVNKKCRHCPTQIVTLDQLRAGESNGLDFWLERLFRLWFPRLNRNGELVHMQDVMDILDQKGIQRSIDFEIGDTLWLIGSTLTNVVDRIKQSPLHLSVKCEMIARKDFKTRSKDGKPEVSFGKFTDVKLSIPGGRKVSELFKFDEGTELKRFEINSCGETRPSLWATGHMVELLSTCKNVQQLHLENLTITVDVPLENEDLTMNNVGELTMHNVNIRLSNRVRRNGKKGAKGTLQKSGSPFMVFEGGNALAIHINSATFNKRHETQQLVLTQLFVPYNHFIHLLRAEAFKTSSLEHLDIVGIAPFWSSLLEVTEFTNLRSLNVVVPTRELGTIYDHALNDMFLSLAERNPSLREVNLIDSRYQLLRSLVT